MKPKQSATSRFALPSVIIIAALGLSSAYADSDSWNVNANGNWNANASWLSGTQTPGTTSGTASTDIATFAFTLGADRVVTVDTDRNIGGITFGANNTNFKYTLSGGNLLLSNGGVIQVDNTATSGTHTDTISSAIAIQGDGGAATFTNAGANARVLSIGAVTGVSNSPNTTALTLNGSNTGANAITGIIGNGVGTGNLGVTKSGAGNWTLSGANTYTGATAISAGTLTISNAATFTNTSAINLGRSGTVNQYSDAATLTIALNSTSADVTKPLTVNQGTSGTLTLTKTGNLRDFLGGITLNNNLTIDGIGSFKTVGISGTGNIITRNSVGFGVANTFTGTVTASTGTLTLSAANALNAAGTTPLTIASGASATLNTADTSLGGSGNTVNVTGTLNLNRSSTANYGGGIITLNNGALLTVSNATNSTDTTGKIVVAAGASASFNRINNTFNSNTNTVATNGLDFGAAGVGATLNHSIPTDSDNMRFLINGTTTFFGNSTINANQADAGDTIHYGRGIVQSGGNYSFTKGGTGVLVLGSATFASTYGGTTTVNAGTLRIGVADSLPDTALAVSSGATFDMSAAGTGITNATFNQRVLGLNDGTGGGGTITGNSINLANSGSIGSRTLTLDGTTGTFTFSGVIQDKPVANVTANSTLSLTKSGGSTQTLSGTNTYAGDTTVDAGTLALADNAQLAFAIGSTSGTNNSISGAGTVTLEGDFNINTTLPETAALTSGSWLLENVASLGGAYGANFQVLSGVTPWSVTGDVWTKTVGAQIYSFDETTGTLTLTGGSASTFKGWASNQVPPVTGGVNGDSDNDGIPNGVEYGLSTNPAGSDGTPGTYVGTLLSFDKRVLTSGNADLSYRIEVSTDLGTSDSWDEVGSYVTNTGSTLSANVPTGPAKNFARLRVVVTP